MSLLKLTLATIGATVLLLGVGRAFPGPVHHALAGVVGLLTILLVIVASRDGRDRTLRYPALAALGLVIAQGAFGAVVARGRLPSVAAAGLVALAMVYLAALVYLAVRARGPRVAAATAPARRGLVLGAGLLLVTQILLGAVVRHAGAGAACGNDLVLCDGRALAATWPAAIHLAHRYLGWILLLVLGGAHVVALREGRRLGRPLVLLLARLAPLLVTAQIGLGLWGVASWTSSHVIAAHLAVAGLLFADLGALYLALGPLGAVAPAPGRAVAPGAATAAAPTRVSEVPS